MSLPDVSFTNNLGTLTFKRCLLAFAERWEWNGRTANRTRQIEVDATLLEETAAEERIDGVLTNQTIAGQGRGTVGTLVLPWVTMTNIKLTALSIPDGAHVGMQKVTASFVDDLPDQNSYTVHFFDIELHNPRISVQLPNGEMRDEYTQMEFNEGLAWDASSYGAAVMRTKSAPGMLQLSLTGTTFFTDGLPPTGWLSKLVQRANMDSFVITNVVPAGWPRPFRMVEASPELGVGLPLVGLIITGGRVVWNVEEGTAEISIEMICQPQRLVTP
jgi:hypothetical protein